MLVLKYQHRLAKLISRYIRDPAEVLDVAQDSFLKAYRALPNFRGESAFYTWLYRIAINTAKNHLVAQRRRPPDGDIDSGDAEQYEGESELKDHATPERLLLRDEIEKTVITA
ncbi:MAG: sigma-70 family RNA polymerase sigma factor, partial [Gammaproteobacteria bacterium]|nr:sigma-70 family RNA polymerase sigma factor [Gammaproteobacteria bacterium]